MGTTVAVGCGVIDMGNWSGGVSWSGEGGCMFVMVARSVLCCASRAATAYNSVESNPLDRSFVFRLEIWVFSLLHVCCSSGCSVRVLVKLVCMSSIRLRIISYVCFFSDSLCGGELAN